MQSGVQTASFCDRPSFPVWAKLPVAEDKSSLYRSSECTSTPVQKHLPGSQTFLAGCHLKNGSFLFPEKAVTCKFSWSLISGS